MRRQPDLQEKKWAAKRNKGLLIITLCLLHHWIFLVCYSIFNSELILEERISNNEYRISEERPWGEHDYPRSSASICGFKWIVVVGLLAEGLEEGLFGLVRRGARGVVFA